MAEIRIMSFNFAPKYWATCDGQLLPINQNQALFSLLGTTYGGNGQTNFALPDLRGRVPIHMGGGFTEGEKAGTENHTITNSELPTHVHTLSGSSGMASSPNPNNLVMARSNLRPYQSAAGGVVAMASDSISNAGGSQSHNNVQPYIVLNFVIALSGVFPSQN